jgi:dipeptidase E
LRLYLSSFRMGDRFDELVAQLGSGAKVAVVSNALDFIPAEARAAYARNVFDPIGVFEDHGLAAANLDLRAYFGSPGRLATDLTDVALVWMTGGNAFLLRRAMRQSGLDEIIQQRVADATMIYAGWSAGAVVAGPTLRGIDLMDDPQVLAEGYESAVIWDGLGLIDSVIVPHFRSPHTEALAADRAVAWLSENDLKFTPLRDGEVLVA